MLDFQELQHFRKHEKFAKEADDVEWNAVRLGTFPLDGVYTDEIATGQFIEDQSIADSHEPLAEHKTDAIEQSIDRKLREKGEEVNRNQKRREDAAAGVYAELKRRSELLGESYPFELGRGSLRYCENDENKHKTYVSLLELTAGESVDRDSFEGIVQLALAAYLGADRAKSKCFGWRTKLEADRPRRIKEMIDQINSESGEWIWRPKHGYPVDPSPQAVKDLGIDVVAWLPVPDKRIGQVFLVAQCATGLTDWESKFDDVNWNSLSNWIESVPKEWGGSRCFAVPFHIPNNARWLHVTSKAGLLLDRARITLLLRESALAV